MYQPRPGMHVELHYRGPRRKGAASLRDYTGLHLARGVVVVVGGGKPREMTLIPRCSFFSEERRHGPFRPSPVNALVELADGRRVVVPRGQLFAVGRDSR